MSGVKHTPGPWVVHSFDGQELNVIPDPDSEYPDTYLGVCTINTWPGERSTRRNEANARLIAAAPDLLEALEPDFMDAVAAVLDANNCHATAGSVRNYAIKQRSAITRATGDRPEKGGPL
jgi:hypothetical protein